MKTPLFPLRITLELTNACNISCTFCPRHNMGNFLGFMDTQIAFRLIDEMAQHLPLTLVPFFRGESLLHPNWYKIIAYAKKKGLGPIQFTTNGTLLDEKNTTRLLNCGVDFMSFSLDTVDKNLYEKSRRGANFSQVQENILRFLHMHEVAGRPFPVQVSAVETEQHKAGMQNFIDFWTPKVDRVRIYTEHSNNGKPGSIHEKDDIFMQRKPCLKVYEDLVILWNADIAICNHDWQRQKEQTVFANVEKDSISSVWNSEAYGQLRMAHEDGNLTNYSPCETCNQWKAFYMPQKHIGKLFTYDEKERHV